MGLTRRRYERDYRQLIEILDRGGHTIELERSRQVYSNRDVNLTTVDAIGFDMDYTLALYRQEAMDSLAIEKTLERLVSERGYCSSVLKIQPRPEFAIRGLMIDKAHGNILKVDAGRHVVKAYHGFRPVENLGRFTYHREAIRFDPERYHLIDTLFGLPEVFLYAALVEHFEQLGAPITDYHRLFDDIRYSIDLCHRDGSLKTAIQGDVARYISRDDRLAPCLHKFRSAGKKLFLMTNSYARYTDVVMSYLLDGKLAASYTSWRSYFDVIITGAKKPTFFTGDEPFLELNGAGDVVGECVGELQRGVIYQGGNLKDFESRQSGVGNRVLYIGDHIYGDILKSKKTSAWKTCMVVQEMSEEVTRADALGPKWGRIANLEAELSRLNEELAYEHHFVHRLEQILRAGGDAYDQISRDALHTSLSELKRSTGETRQRRQALVAELMSLDRELDTHFNPFWGPTFQAGNELSVFGAQVKLYADLYTSSVGNFLAYSPMQYFRAQRVMMPHEI